jgi:Holliday junction resolvasome RuvABC endonuclease subunit
MSTIVGIDPSLTSTGIAILVHGQPLTLTTVGHGTRNGKSYAHRSDRIVSQCRAIIDCLRTHTPRGGYDLAVIEGPAYGANLPSAHDRAGLFWGLISTLRAKRIPTVVIPPATLKLWATGQGRADKTLMLATVRDWWPLPPSVRDHNQADAAALATIGAAHHGDPLPFELKPRHHNTLNTIDWPVTA